MKDLNLDIVRNTKKKKKGVNQLNYKTFDRRVTKLGILKQSCFASYRRDWQSSGKGLLIFSIYYLGESGTFKFTYQPPSGKFEKLAI